MLIYDCTVLNIFFSFASLLLSRSTNKSCVKVSNIRFKSSYVKLNTTLLDFTEAALLNNSFKRSYSTKKNSYRDSLNNYGLNLDQENIDNSSKDLIIEEDLKALHSLYIKDLFKDRIAPVVPFDSKT